jgi:hypothetical protein
MLRTEGVVGVGLAVGVDGTESNEFESSESVSYTLSFIFVLHRFEKKTHTNYLVQVLEKKFTNKNREKDVKTCNIGMVPGRLRETGTMDTETKKMKK